MKTKKEFDYDQWRVNKVNEISKNEHCSKAEATIIFLLQDISYKLSYSYKKPQDKNNP